MQANNDNIITSPHDRNSLTFAPNHKLSTNVGNISGSRPGRLYITVYSYWRDLFEGIRMWVTQVDTDCIESCKWK